MTETPKLLVFDSNVEDRERIIGAMRTSSPPVLIQEVNDAEAFQAILDMGDFNLAITEYYLGWTNGLAVLKAIKGRKRDCPVIMLTGSGSEEAAVEAMKAGVDDYLVKCPATFEQLPKLVDRVQEQRWYRQALRVSETRFRELFDTVPVGLYRTSLTGLIVDANLAMVKMLGYPSRESLLMVKVRDLLADPEDGRRIHMLLECESVVQNYRLQLRRKDGSVVWAENNARAMMDDSQQVLYHEGSLVDITDRVRVEDALKERERFLSNLLASIQDGISILDIDLKIVYVNPTMERWYAHQMPVVGKKCYEAYHGRSMPCEICPTAVTLKNGTATCEMVPKVGPEGKTGWLELCAYPFVDTVSGRVEGIIEYVRDKSEKLSGKT